MRRALKPALIAVFVLIAGILLKGSIPQPPTGSWLSFGAMTDARSGAASGLLQDGRILITGGDNGSGPVASAEILDTTGAFVAAPPMNNPRSRHIAIVLHDGRVLVAGGLTTGGSATNGTEIFDPAANSWTSVSLGMGEARSGAAAVLLQDGRVVIAGGQNGSTVSSTMEVFDPIAGTFAFAGMMSSPRSQFAMTVLQDGRVLIVGGNNGTAPVASTDVFDPVAGAVSAGPNLSMARFGHSATTLLNGQVVVVGGNNGNADPAQMDVTPAELIDFTAATPAFTTLLASLATSREGHLAFLLPNNNNVLIVGGTSAGVTIASAELFSQWQGTFAATGTMTAARSNFTGSANQTSAPTSVMQRNGFLLAAGGHDANGNTLNAAEAYGYATVQTDQSDYAPGSVVTITGSGWQPGETVMLTLVESPFYDSHGPFTTVADSSGNISNNQFSPDEHDASIRFYLTAAGSVSGIQAQNTFTDSKTNTVAVASPTSLTVAPGATAVYGNVTVTFNGTGSSCIITLGATGLPSGTTPVFGNSPATSVNKADVISSFSVNTTNATTLGSKTINVTATDGAGCDDTKTTSSINLTLVVQEPTTTTLASSPNPSTYGQSITLTATVAQTAGTTVPTGTVTFNDGATSVGSGNLNGSGVATLNISTLTAGSHNLTASYAGVTNTFGASASNTVTQTVNQATPTITFGAAPTPTYLGGNFTVSATTTNTDSAALTYSRVSGPCALVSGATFNSSGAGVCAVQASGAATTNFQAASNTQSVTIAKATPTLSVTNSPVTYDGAAQAAAVSSSVPGTVSSVKYNGSATVPTNAGTYAITADFAPTDTNDYNSLSAASAGNFVINRVSPTLSVTNSPVTFNGSPQTASVSGSVPGAVSNVKYNVSPTVPTNANTYAITADFTPTDATNYSSLSGAPAGNFVINKATPTMSVTNSPVTYDGTPQAATVAGSVGGTVSTVKYNGSATVPTNAGTYAITANFTPTDTTNYNSLTAASAGNFVINKASPTLSVTNSPVTYNGTPQVATVSGSVAGTVSNIKYAGSAAAPTNAGTYAITADFGPTDTTNYNSLSAASAGNFVINKATPTLAVTNSPVTYSGSPQAASVSGSVPGAVSNVKYNGSATVPTNASTYAITADFTPTDATNYSVLSGVSAGNFVITQATPTVTVSGGPFTYDGNQHAATGSATGVGGANVTGTFAFTYTPPGNSTAPTNAGTYSVNASFTSTDPNYGNAAGSGSITIDKAMPVFSPALSSPAAIPFGRATVSLPPVSVMVVSGGIRAASPDTVTITINGTSSGAIPFNGSSGTFGPINFDTHAIPVGSYAITYSYSGGANFKSITDTSTMLTVTKVTPTVAWATPTAITFNTALGGTQLNATFNAIVNGVSVPVAGTPTYNPAAGTILNAGAGQTLSVNFVPTDTADYNNASGSVLITVNKAATSTAVTSNNNPSFSGQSVTFTATVSNTSGTSAVPTGSVQFMDGASALGTPQPLVAGKATLTTSALTVAIHSITAVYTNSDGNFSASTSAAFSQTVKSADTTTSISAPAITFGANGLVTVTVVAVDPSAGTPTGNVTLSVDGGTAVSQALTNGSTIFTVSNPSGGSHSLSASYAAQNSFNSSSATGSLQVNQAAQSITVTMHAPASAAYGASFGVAATVTSGLAVAITTSGSCSGSGTSSATINMTSGTGTCVVHYNQPGNTNYSAATEITDSTTATQLTPTVTVTDPMPTFDGTPKLATAVATGLNNAVVSGSFSFTYDGTGAGPTNAKTYAVVATFTSSDPNYTGATGNGFLTIKPAAATASVIDTMPTYDRTAKFPTVTTTPIGLTIAVTYSLSGNPVVSPTVAGVYSVTVMITDSNYTGGGSGTLTIKQAQLTVTATDASRPYAQANPTFTGTLTGVIAGDGITASYASAATSATAAGVYGPTAANAIIPTLNDPNNKLPNYQVTSTNGTLTITAVPLYVIANDKTRAFGIGNPAFDAQYVGFVNGDQPTSLTGSLDCPSANASASAGTYAIHCGGLSSVDYAIYFVDGTLTVTDPLSTIMVNPSAPTVTYGGMQTFTAQGTFASTMTRNLANAGGMNYQLHDLSMTRSGAAAAEAGGKLYTIGGVANGGTVPSDAVEVYDPMNDAAGWTAAGNLGSPRTNARAASVAGKVYVFGGCSDAICNSVLGTAEVYDPTSSTWSAISSTGFTARSNAAAIPLNGKIYVAGGNDGSGMPLKTVEIYDPGKDSWTTGAPLDRAAGPASGGVINGTLYVVSIASGDAVVQSFNVTMWTTVNDSVQAVGDAAAAVLNNMIYVVDGANVHAYDVTHNVWADKASLNAPRLRPEPVAIGNLIYVAGNGASGQSASLEAFAGDEASWSSSDTTIATIDQSGKASALKVGSSTITGTSLIIPSVSGNTLMTVGPVTVTPVVSVSDKKYDGTNSATITNETLTGVLSGDESSVSLTGGTATFDTKNVGASKTVTVTGLTLSGSKATDYVLSSTTATATASIKPVYVQVTASSATVTYGDAVPTITPSYSGFISGEDQINADGFAAPTCVTNYTNTSNAGGSYYTRCSAATATNYKFTYVDGSVTVLKATANISVTPYNVTYDGNSHTATGTVTGVGGADLSASLNLTGTTHTNAGTYAADSWTFTGGTNYNDANGTVKDYIKKANAVVTITPYSVTYDGHPHTAMVASISGVNGETGATVGTVDASHTTHTDAGTYSTDYWTFAGTPNYNNIGNTIITDTINKATATVVVMPYNVTYDGDPHTATITSITGVNGETGATVGTVDVSHTTHTAAGTYSSDYWSFTGAANYNDIGSTNILDVIKKATATIAVTPYSVTYDGNPHTAAGTAIGVKSEALAGLDLTGTTHTNSGTTTDIWTFTDVTGNYYNATSTVSDVIKKATAAIAVTPYSVTYDGNPHTATGTATGVKNEMLAGLDLSGTTHTDAGTYTDAWTFTDVTGNYNNANSTVHDSIAKANATINVTPYNVTYDANAHTATGSATGVAGVNLSGSLTLTGTTHTNAGDYAADAWSFGGGTNYNDASGSVHDSIAKANATINVTPYGVIYDGNAHTATGTATGVKGETLTGLDLSATMHTGVGTTTDTWTFTDGTGNYNNGSSTASDIIKAAPLTITAGSGSMIYGGPVFPVGPSYTGFVHGETTSSLTNLPTCGTTATSMSSVSGNPYVSTCLGAAAANYSISYAPGVVTVTQATTTTAVVSSVNPSTYMQLVTFTASVTPQYAGTTPTGTVTFYNNGTSIGTGILSLSWCGTPPCSDQATFSTSTLPDTGPDSITAVYSGDNNFIASNNNAAPLMQTVQPAPNVSLSPMSVSFGNQNVNTSSRPATVTLTNIGDAILNISNVNGIAITPSTDFTQTNTCGASVVAGGSCKIYLTFTPVDTGIRTAVLTITDNDDDATNAQQTVSLSGSGLSTITGNSLFTDAIFATANGCGSIVMSGGSTVDSFSSAQGYSSSHQLSGGNVGTNGNVALNGSKSAIYGTAAVNSQTTGSCSKTAVTGITSNGGAQITGGPVPLSTSINYPTPPAPNPAPPTTSQNISGSCGSVAGCANISSKTVNLAPGQYGNLTLSGGTTAHFSKGTYSFNSLTLSGQSIVYVDSGPVVINLAGTSLSGGNPALDATGGSMQNPSGNPANLQITYAGSRGLNLSGGATSYATVYAPNALVNMSGGTDFFGSIIASTITNSGGTAIHYDTGLPAIQHGTYIWFNAVVNNVAGLPPSGQVKLYLTNSSITFTANGVVYNIPVPNGVVTFNSTSTLGTTFGIASNRWSTSVPKSSLTGNTFVTGVAFPVPVDFPTGIQNVAWQTSFSTDSPGITMQWQWGAAVYSSFSTTYATTTPLNNNGLGVNAEDGTANMYGTDPAGTPETYKGGVTFGATGGGGTNYTGYFSPAAGVVPTVAPMSVSPSSLDFGSQNQGTTSGTMTTVLTNNDSTAHTISSIAVMGTNFTQTNNCPMSPTALAGGASCTIAVTFTPSDVGTRTAKIVLNDDANNSPQTVYLSGTGQ